MSRLGDGRLPKYDVEVSIPTVDGGATWLRVCGSSYLADAKIEAESVVEIGWRHDGPVRRPVVATRVIVRATGEIKAERWATGEQLRAALRFNDALAAKAVAS